MPLVVQKYGGTSIGTIEKISSVADKIISEKNKGNDLVVVVSAMSGETNRLLDLGQSIDPDVSGRELDTLVSTGEQVTI
jgi:aspartate kinase